jgi:hypothetical protein
MACGVSALAIFPDRAPFIWFWRPTYRVFGSWIRQCKALITSSNEIELQHEMRFARIEAAQRETSELLEQLVVTMLGDQQVPRAIEEMRAVLAWELSKHAAETSAANADQWAAIEQLVLARMANSNSSQIARNNHHASTIEPAPSSGEIG